MGIHVDSSNLHRLKKAFKVAICAREEKSGMSLTFGILFLIWGIKNKIKSICWYLFDCGKNGRNSFPLSIVLIKDSVKDKVGDKSG
jgi:hypothetical protein